VSGHRSIERRLPTILADLGAGPSPEYTDSLLARTAAARQRPGWAFLERWIPMSTAYSSSVATPRIPWRVVGALALLILAIAVGALVIAGNQPRPLPAPPFGRAANGLLAYAVDGDIYTSDPVTGETRAIVSGPDDDGGPIWSRDGTRMAFVRRVEGESFDRLYVARSDGTALTEITTEPLRSIGYYSFSPDGRQVVLASDSTSQGKMHIANADGSGVRALDVGIPAKDLSFRPPDGKQIAFTGYPSGDDQIAGIYVVDTDGSDVRMLVGPARDASASGPLWSPDGSRIAYGLVNFNVPQWTVHTRVMSADGSDDRALPMPTDAQFNYNATWSNDGTRLVMVRGYAVSGEGDNVAAVVPADGSGPGLETARSLFPDQGLSFEWAPDDTSVVVVRHDARGQPFESQLMDPVTGAIRSAPYSVTSLTTWQRLAPGQ
jgi:dipeptidyl aminopeptidase/acylaminoacyl peptidase